VGELAKISISLFLFAWKSFTGKNFLTEQEANLIRSEGYKRPARGQNKVCNVSHPIFNAYNFYATRAQCELPTNSAASYPNVLIY
jgi:hypothetical protein